MFEQVIYLGKENFYIEEFGIIRSTVENTSDFNPLLSNGVVKNHNKFFDLIKTTIEKRNKSKNLTILVPDIMLISKVLHFEKLPISLKKKNELILWKLENYLPAKHNLYDIKYTIYDNNVLTFALPKNTNNTLNEAIVKNTKENFNILPEFLYMLEIARKNELNNCILIINRKNYFTASYLKNRLPLFIRTRQKTNSINMEEEVNLVKEIVNESWQEEKQVFVVGEYFEPYKSIEQEWL